MWQFYQILESGKGIYCQSKMYEFLFSALNKDVCRSVNEEKKTENNTD